MNSKKIISALLSLGLICTNVSLSMKRLFQKKKKPKQSTLNDYGSLDDAKPEEESKIQEQKEKLAFTKKLESYFDQDDDKEKKSLHFLQTK